MPDIDIAKVRVKGVEEVTIKGGGYPDKQVIATTLLIEPLEAPSDPRMATHGTITVPMQLPFGKKFTLVLRDIDSVVLQPQGRQFKEDV